MPPLPKLRTQPLAELARQLRFESPEAARMQLERTEALALEILQECGVPGSPVAAAIGDKAYPLDYIVFRITGMRAEHSGEGGSDMLVGAALLGDLAALTERLSTAAGITLTELRARGDWLTIEDLQTRWNLGRKSVERERRRGLISRRALDPARRARARAAVVERIMVSRRALEAFERAGGRAAPATARSKRPAITDAQREHLAQLARQDRILHGWSMNKCAQALAGWEGLTAQSIARALRRHDQTSDEPIFGKRRAVSDRSRSRLARASRKGLSPARLSGRLQRSRGTTYRIVAEERLALLRTLRLDGPVGQLFDRPDAEEVLLSPGAVRHGLGEPAPATIGETIALADAMSAPDADTELARAVAIALLRYRVRTFLAAAPAKSIRAADLYAAETRLLWASRLKAELVRAQLPAALRTARARLGGRDPATFPARPGKNAPTLSGVFLARAMVSGAIEAVDRFDPLRGGRLAAATTIAVNRSVGAWMQANGVSDKPDPGAARALPSCSAETIGDWTSAVDRWQAWLEPDPVVTAWARSGAATDPAWDRRAARLAETLQLRYGLTGGPPRSPHDLAAELGTTPTRIIARERAGVARAFQSVQQPGKPRTTP